MFALREERDELTDGTRQDISQGADTAHGPQVEGGEEEGGGASDHLKVLVAGPGHHAGNLGDVAARLLDADNVGMSRQVDDGVQGQVQGGVGGDAVQQDRDRTGICYGGVVRLQSCPCHSPCRSILH